MKKRMIALLLLAMLLLLSSCQTAQPREIREARINDKGELELLYTDGTQSNLGVVRGSDGQDGRDGADGKDGEKGATGAVGPEGPKGPTGAAGTPGRDGREITDIQLTADGNLAVYYDNRESTVVEMLGKLYLFGGQCATNENAVWAVYNGGLLILGGAGEMDYAAGSAPWSSIIPLLTGVFVDTSNGLTLGENTLAGFDAAQIFYPEEPTYIWVDMTVSAPLYETADAEGTKIADLPLGTRLEPLGTEGDFTKVSYEGEERYIETRYTVASDGSVVYDPITEQVTVTNDAGANLRTFPDATEASAHNIHVNVPKGTTLNCTGISRNGRWLRIDYEGRTLYCLANLVTAVV